MSQPVFGNLYQFTERGGQMSLPVHQYLLLEEPSVMIATGSFDQAKWILPQIDVLLRKKPLDYLFISHMESDECGGVSLFVKKYPKITIICSSFTARELRGFGIMANIHIGEEGRPFNIGNLSLNFIRYPSEVHMNEGVLLYEANNRVLYTSDLIMHRISNGGSIINGKLDDEICSIDSVHNIDDSRREILKDSIRSLSPAFIATGHGSCIRIDH